MDHAACVEGGCEISMRPRADRLLEQRKQRFAMCKAQAIIRGEAHAATGLQGCDGLPKTKCIDQISPLTRGHDHNHCTYAVCGHEVATEQTIDCVAKAWPVLALIEDFRNPTEIGNRADCNIG